MSITYITIKTANCQSLTLQHYLSLKDLKFSSRQYQYISLRQQNKQAEYKNILRDKRGINNMLAYERERIRINYLNEAWRISRILQVKIVQESLSNYRRYIEKSVKYANRFLKVNIAWREKRTISVNIIWVILWMVSHLGTWSLSMTWWSSESAKCLSGNVTVSQTYMQRSMWHRETQLIFMFILYPATFVNFFISSNNFLCEVFRLFYI